MTDTTTVVYTALIVFGIIGLTEVDRLALTEQSISHSREKLQTVSRQDMTAEYQTCGQMETWLLKDMGETAGKPIDVAVTLRARDYKGLDNYGSNGVIEVMADVNVIGSLEAKFESTSRIYDVGGVQSDIGYNARW